MPANPRRARSKPRSRAASSPSPQLRAAPKRRTPAAAKAANTNDAVCRDRLGVALAGGGFRAALFHVGVLRRLAELDLLRYVEVLSTVSGGSIVGALYVLLLKRELEREKDRTVLTRADYGGIIDHLEARLVAGIRRNLRARLFSDPFDLIRIMLGPSRTFGDRMAELYHKHIYAETVNELDRPNRDGPLLLKELLIQPGRNPVGALLRNGDIDSYNRSQVESGGSVVTKLVINATSLNTGARFLFKATEIGEWQYGYARSDEAGELARRKREIDGILREPKSDRHKTSAGAPPETLARWIITGETAHLTADAGNLVAKWPPPFDIEKYTGRGAGLQAVRTTELGALRLARLAAWHLRHLDANPTLHASGGFTTVEHRHDLAVNLGLITHNYAVHIEQWFAGNHDLLMPLCGFLDEVYLYRSARNIAESIESDWERWRLSAAVAASANFPPVFPPLLEYQTYDNLVVSRLGLTDGGVYDNLGVMGLLNEGCNYIISSDTGLIDKPAQHVSQGHIGMVGRITSITTDNAARQMRNRLVDRHQVSAGLESVCWAARPKRAKREETSLADSVELVHATRRLQGYIGMRIDSPAVVELEASETARVGAGKIHGFNAATVGALRTDLDLFGDIEVNALINQGYANAGLYVKQWLDYGARNGKPDDRPPHARDRYGSTACHVYPYRRAGDSSYRDARLPPHHRPIANTIAGGIADPRDTRAARVLRAGRRKFLRVLQCGRPWGVGLVLPWVVVIAFALAALVAGWWAVSEGGRWERLVLVLPAISASAVYWAVVLLVLYLFTRWGLKTAINWGIRRAEDKGRLDCARQLAAMRRWPARLVFWLALAALALVGAAFWPTALERSLVEQLVTVTRNLAIEVVAVVGLAFVFAIAGWLMWLDGWLAAAMQRLNNSSRPSGTDGR